jgi:hypothetical protein
LERVETKLTFEISTDKARYGVGEDIIVRLCLFNFGDDPITVNSRFALNRAGFPGEVAFDVVEASGKPVSFRARVNVGTPDDEDFSLLVPWNCVGRECALQPYFALERAGRYTLTATYKNEWSGEDVGLDAWTGRLRSNTVTFVVEKESAA